MTLYGIDQQIQGLINPETGELLDYEAFANLQMERDKKCENIALWVKDLSAEAKAIKAEIDSLTKRKNAAEAKAKRLKGYLELALDGQAFKTPKCAVSFRKTSSLEVTDETALIEWAEQNGHDDCLKYAPVEVKKKDFTDLIKQGIEIPFAQIVRGKSLVVR